MKPRISPIAALLVVLALAVGVVLLWQFTRPRLTDEQRLYSLLTNAQVAAEKHNLAGLTRLISRDYHDRMGIDKRQMNGMIASWLQGAPPLKVVPTVAGLKVNGATADMQVKIRYWSGDPNSPGDEFAMALRWQKERGTWKITSAEGWESEQGKAMGGE